MSLALGTIVVPTGGDERIVGIVLQEATGLTNPWPLVLWLSADRGAFVCTDDPSFIEAASVSERNFAPDDKINHLRLAQLVLGNLDTISLPR